MNDLSDESRALLRAARDELDAGDAERGRVGRRLALRLGVAAGTATVTSAASASVPPAAVVAPVAGSGSGAWMSAIAAGTKWLGTAVLVGSLGYGGAALVRPKHEASRPSAPSSVVAPSVVASSPRGAVPAAPMAAVPAKDPASDVKPFPVVSAPRSARVEPQRPAARQSLDSRGPAVDPPSPISASPSVTVLEEARLVRRAEEALRGGDAANALALLQQHAREYPNGVLAEERSAELVSALCRLGRGAEAREQAARFLRAYSDSPLAASVGDECGGARAGQAR